MRQRIITQHSFDQKHIMLTDAGLGSALAKLLERVDRKIASLRDKLNGKKSLKNRPWRLLQVESAIACNLKCVMCPWREIAKKATDRGIMAPEIWEAIRPYLSQVQSVDFTGGGEPLLQPKLAEWIADATKAGCETGFLSNGLLLKEEKLKKILYTGINWICISMDGATAEMYNKIRVGSNFDRVCENVANIARFRAGNIPKTMINFVLMDINSHQMEEIVQLAARLGVDQLNFKQCDVIRGQEGKGFGLFASEENTQIRGLQKSLKKARRLAKKLNVETTAFAFTPQELAVCDQDPRDSLYIRYDGTVAPCINLALGGQTTFLGNEVDMPSVHYGKLPEDDLMDLWETESCQFYRQRFAERFQTHENLIVRNLFESGGSGRKKILQSAREAMPDPPKGCNVCHYLYDIWPALRFAGCEFKDDVVSTKKMEPATRNP
jgi:MoaA/NifB/PqqE/SkfB family radical SAM enzyme